MEGGVGRGVGGSGGEGGGGGGVGVCEGEGGGVGELFGGGQGGDEECLDWKARVSIRAYCWSQQGRGATYAPVRSRRCC